MLAARTLHESALVQIRDVACNAPRGGCGAEEAVPVYNLVLPLSGAFTWHAGLQETLVDSNSVMLLSPRAGHRISHPFDGGDRCVSLRYNDTVAFEAFRSDAVGPKYWLLDNSTQRRFSRLVHRMLSISETLAAEEAALEILELVSALPRTESSKPASLVAERVRAYINERFSANDDLCGIAAAVGYSPFHLLRLFRTVTGTTIHQYRQRIRLAAGFERLRLGDEPISRIAADLGFCDHSHFAAAFARVYGVTPSGVRNDVTRT